MRSTTLPAPLSYVSPSSNSPPFQSHPHPHLTFASVSHTQINVATLAAAKGAVVKSTGGRVKAIAKRYGLEITTTTKGDSNAAMNSTTNGSGPATPASKATTTRKRKAPAGKSKAKGSSEDDEEGARGEIEVNGKGSEDDGEGVPVAKKGKKSKGKMEMGDDAATVDEDAEENADEEVA